MHTLKSIRIFSWYNQVNVCMYVWGFSGSSVVKIPPASAGDARDTDLIPGLGRSPAEGNGNPFQYSCLENPVERSLAGYSPWGHEDLDMTEHVCVYVIICIYAHLRIYNFLSIVKVSMSDCLEGGGRGRKWGRRNFSNKGLSSRALHPVVSQLFVFSRSEYPQVWNSCLSENYV